MRAAFTAPISESTLVASGSASSNEPWQLAITTVAHGIVLRKACRAAAR
jgi:hypothetical protein